MNSSIIYLDTSHLSALARFPTRPECEAVRRILDAGSASLALSLIHLHELSDPRFIDRDAVGEMLDRSPVLWGINFTELFDLEVRHVFQKVVAGAAPPIVVFYSDIRHAWSAPDMDVPSIVEMLRQFAARPDLRSQFPASAMRGAQLDAVLKTSAAVIRDPNVPILSKLREMKLNETPSGIRLPSPYPADELLKRAGGLAAFPAYNVFQALHKTRLGDVKFPTKPNDLLDEWHACYSPYAEVTVLDRTTVGRCRSANLPHLDRITAKLGDVERILRTTLAGTP